MSRVERVRVVRLCLSHAIAARVCGACGASRVRVVWVGLGYGVAPQDQRGRGCRTHFCACSTKRFWAARVSSAKTSSMSTSSSSSSSSSSSVPACPSSSMISSSTSPSSSSSDFSLCGRGGGGISGETDGRDARAAQGALGRARSGRAGGRDRASDRSGSSARTHRRVAVDVVEVLDGGVGRDGDGGLVVVRRLRHGDVLCRGGPLILGLVEDDGLGRLLVGRHRAVTVHRRYDRSHRGVYERENAARDLAVRRGTRGSGRAGKPCGAINTAECRRFPLAAESSWPDRSRVVARRVAPPRVAKATRRARRLRYRQTLGCRRASRAARLRCSRYWRGGSGVFPHKGATTAHRRSDINRRATDGPILR